MALLLFKLKCRSPWDYPLEYVHAMSLRSELKGGGETPTLQAIEIGTVFLPPFSVGQANH